MPCVLVVAGDAELGSALVDVLTHEGFACLRAEDGPGVESALRAEPAADCAVLDVADARSRAVLTAARPLLAARGVPLVLALWPFEPPEPAAEIVRKPIAPAELVSAVRRALGRP